MAKRLTKKMTFLLSLMMVGMFGMIQSLISENFSQAKSSFKKEDISSNFVETAHADVAPACCPDGSDGSGDGSNGF